MKIIEIRCVDPKPRMVAGDTKIFIGDRCIGTGTGSINLQPDPKLADHYQHLHVSVLAEQQLMSRDATRRFIGFTQS